MAPFGIPLFVGLRVLRGFVVTSLKEQQDLTLAALVGECDGRG